DLPVTGRAADAFVYVNAVVEVHEVRQIVHARPLNRSPGAEAVAHRLEVRAVRKDLRMAIHARFGRRDPCERRILDRRMAVPAVDAVAGDVAFMAELNRLLARDVRLCHPRWAVHL